MDPVWLLKFESDRPLDEDVAASTRSPRLAVKDCIDVAGAPTTVGCRAIALDAKPAAADAPVVERARRQGARIVGKTNLVELCRHADGVNAWTGTPTNPVDPDRIPGGSSSGSAVAVALGQADVGYGTDTGGSVRVPAACCGVAGMKTTRGRMPTHGIFEYSRTLDTVGPLARDVTGVATGMRLMEPGFAAQAADTAGRDGDRPRAARLRMPDTDPAFEAAIDAALDAAGYLAEDVEIPRWADWIEAADDIMLAEGYLAHRHLLERAELLEERHVHGIVRGGEIPIERVIECRRIGTEARRRLNGLFREFDVLALPTLLRPPPPVRPYTGTTFATVPLNLTGLPALTLPLPASDGSFPPSLQLVGAWFAEEELIGHGLRVERAVR